MFRFRSTNNVKEVGILAEVEGVGMTVLVTQETVVVVVVTSANVLVTLGFD
jgi:hypothetical protein